MKVQIVNKSKHNRPDYETAGSAGMDLISNLDEPITIKPMERVLVPTGLYMAIPIGYEGQIRSRSGLTIKHGIVVANGVGTIDSDYRGEIKVIIINLGTEDFTIKDGDRIAQMIFNRYATVEFMGVKKLDETERAEGGFGSTGK